MGLPDIVCPDKSGKCVVSFVEGRRGIILRRGLSNVCRGDR